MVFYGNYPISFGYNGTPKGLPNCNEGGCDRCIDLTILSGERYDECLCLHAEENAIIRVDSDKCENGKLYCSYHPCLGCAKKIIQIGIKEVIYKEGFYTNASELLKKACVNVWKF